MALACSYFARLIIESDVQCTHDIFLVENHSRFLVPRVNKKKGKKNEGRKKHRKSRRAEGTSYSCFSKWMKYCSNFQNFHDLHRHLFKFQCRRFSVIKKWRRFQNMKKGLTLLKKVIILFLEKKTHFF